MGPVSETGSAGCPTSDYARRDVGFGDSCRSVCRFSRCDPASTRIDLISLGDPFGKLGAGPGAPSLGEKLTDLRQPKTEKSPGSQMPGPSIFASNFAVFFTYVARFVQAGIAVRAAGIWA